MGWVSQSSYLYSWGNGGGVTQSRNIPAPPPPDPTPEPDPEPNPPVDPPVDPAAGDDDEDTKRRKDS